jgi:DNA-binding winged helix-turn-helix (wHTH) protein
MKRLLLEGEQAVHVGSRALEILIALVERKGELVTKRELISRVWPNMVVVEGNLSVHVAALRHVLRDGRDGSRYLVNIPGQGYRFVAPVAVIEDEAALSPHGDSPLHRSIPPASTTWPLVQAERSRINDPLRVFAAVASALGFEICAEDVHAERDETHVRLILDGRVHVAAAMASLHR